MKPLKTPINKTIRTNKVDSQDSYREDGHSTGNSPNEEEGSTTQTTEKEGDPKREAENTLYEGSFSTYGDDFADEDSVTPQEATTNLSVDTSLHEKKSTVQRQKGRRSKDSPKTTTPTEASPSVSSEDTAAGEGNNTARKEDNHSGQKYSNATGEYDDTSIRVNSVSSELSREKDEVTSSFVQPSDREPGERRQVVAIENERLREAAEAGVREAMDNGSSSGSFGSSKELEMLKSQIQAARFDTYRHSMRVCPRAVSRHLYHLKKHDDGGL